MRRRPRPLVRMAPEATERPYGHAKGKGPKAEIAQARFILAAKGDSAMSRAQTIAVKPSPAGWFRWLIILGLLAALMIAAVVALIDTIEVSRRCQGGGFSSGFSVGFDTRRCEIIFRAIQGWR